MTYGDDKCKGNGWLEAQFYWTIIVGQMWIQENINQGPFTTITKYSYGNQNEGWLKLHGKSLDSEVTENKRGQGYRVTTINFLKMW